MAASESVDRPVRAGVFASLDDARRVVEALRNASYSNDEITVVCSDETKEKYFRELEHQQPAGANTPLAATAGGMIGATLFGLATVGIGMATGGVPLLVAGGWGAWTGGVLGGFVGAMMTRGIEKEAADYYDQAVVRGEILVAVETSDQARLDQAERILSAGGAKPLALPEG
jgi:outer membrane lipoprotein SlyB